jgi:4-hydroxy-3-polyprenylbenzoate decarboxylase
MTGATGAVYGIRLLEALRELGIERHLVVSRWAGATIRTETDVPLEAIRALATVAHDETDLSALPGKPGFATAGMVIAPCSMRTLAAVAHGRAENLIQLAASVHLRERRRLVLLVRESPLSVIHLENMLRAARVGAVIAPPLAAFTPASVPRRHGRDHTVAERSTASASSTTGSTGGGSGGVGAKGLRPSTLRADPGSSRPLRPRTPRA